MTNIPNAREISDEVAVAPHGQVFVLLLALVVISGHASWLFVLTIPASRARTLTPSSRRPQNSSDFQQELPGDTVLSSANLGSYGGKNPDFVRSKS